jgi:hypothetical protein
MSEGGCQAGRPSARISRPRSLARNAARHQLVAASYLLAGAAMRNPICTSVHPAFFRIVPTSPRGLDARPVCMTGLGCLHSFSSRVYNLASVVT